MKFSASIVLAAALGVTAHPSGHAHKHAHRSLEARDFVTNKKPDVTQPDVPTTTSVTVQAVSSAASNSGSNSSGQGVSSFTPFCKGEKTITKRVTAEQVSYVGNIGTADSFGCNMMLAQSDAVKDYDYSLNLENVSGDDQSCICALKIGKDGGINGFFKGNEVLTFDIPTGSNQHVVVDENTQGWCACGSGSVELTSFGQYAGTWVEFDMANESNQKWSGADASCIVAASQKLEIPGLQVCNSDASVCSTIYPGGTGENAFLGGDEYKDGLGLNLPAGPVALNVKVGFSG